VIGAHASSASCTLGVDTESQKTKSQSLITEYKTYKSYCCVASGSAILQQKKN